MFIKITFVSQSVYMNGLNRGRKKKRQRSFKERKSENRKGIPDKSRIARKGKREKIVTESLKLKKDKLELVWLGF